MKDNLIPFPTPLQRDASQGRESKEMQDERQRLRQAFELARKEWPLELSELPESNRIKRSS